MKNFQSKYSARVLTIWFVIAVMDQMSGPDT